MVAHAGFEPAVSALRGRRPSPLDEWAAIMRHSGAHYTLVQAICLGYFSKFAALLHTFQTSFSFTTPMSS